MDFEDAGRGLRGGFQLGEGVVPVDGAVAGPEMRVLLSLVVVEVGGADPGAQLGQLGADAIAEMGVSYIEADADVLEMADGEDFDEVGGTRDLALEILDQDFDAEGIGEGAQMLEGGDGMLETALAPAIVALAEVEDEEAEGDLFGDFEGALDLVHGIDAPALFGMDDIDGGGAAAAHLLIGKHGAVHGEGVDRIGAEPFRQLADMGAAGVVEVLAGGEDLHALGAGASESVKKTRMEAMLEKNV